MGHRNFSVLVTLLVGMTVLPAFAFDEADLEQLKATGICKNCDLTDADLTGADLAGANLGGSNLYRAELVGVNLSGAFLTRANLAFVNFENADLTGADLTGANQAQAIFCKTIMPGGEIRNPNCSATLSDSTLVDLIEVLEDAVVAVYEQNDEGNNNFIGSGFFVTSDGYTLTNEHVVAGVSDLYVKTLDRDYMRAKVIKTDKKLDLALLRVVNPKRTFKSVDIGNSRQLQKGQSVLNIGTPIDPEFEHSATPGHIAGLNRVFANVAPSKRGWIQLSLPTYGGQSGSPVFDMNGRVIGVIVAGPNMPTDFYAYFETDDGSSQLTSSKNVEYEEGLMYIASENIGLAIPIHHASNLLQLTG